MAEKVIENQGSREYVALELAREISTKEEMYRDSSTFRKKYLDLYAECLQATYLQRRFM